MELHMDRLRIAPPVAGTEPRGGRPLAVVAASVGAFLLLTRIDAAPLGALHTGHAATQGDATAHAARVLGAGSCCLLLSAGARWVARA